MNALNIIFMLSCYPIIFLMYFLLRNAKDKNGWCFGATLSKELKKDPAVEAVDVEYRKNLKNSMIVLGTIPFVCFFIPYMSISFTIWMIWILVICFLPMYWYAKANKKIQELKRVHGWNETNEVAYADLKIAAVPRKVKFLHFMPLFIFSVVPVMLSYQFFNEAGYGAFRFCVIAFAICTVLFYVCAVWTDRQKINVICDDSDTNMNFARAKKMIWKKFWMICAGFNTMFIWCILAAMIFREHGMNWILIGSVLYGIVTIGIAMWLVKKLLEINQKYEVHRTVSDASDNDKYWPYGLMYYNPNDKHIMVENRMGTGTAMNMATGTGKSMYIIATLCLLIIPVSCIWMIMLDFTPIQTTVVEDTIICQHLSIEYEIPLEDIEEYTIITELPEMTKMKGNGMDHVLSGTYEIYREGTFETFLNPQNNLFIKIVTEDEMYYISGIDDAETKAIIEQLK